MDAHRVGALNQHLLAEGHARGQSGFALSDIFVSTTLGARIADLNVSSSANAEFAATLIFVAYLVRVRVRGRGRGRDRGRVGVRVRGRVGVRIRVRVRFVVRVRDLSEEVCWRIHMDLSAPG